MSLHLLHFCISKFFWLATLLYFTFFAHIFHIFCSYFISQLFLKIMTSLTQIKINTVVTFPIATLCLAVISYLTLSFFYNCDFVSHNCECFSLLQLCFLQLFLFSHICDFHNMILYPTCPTFSKLQLFISQLWLCFSLLQLFLILWFNFLFLKISLICNLFS